MVIGIELMLIVLFCVLIGVNSFVLGRRTNAEMREAAANASKEDEVDALLRAVSDARAENARLKERLEVLERLATDGDEQLKREIDKLRKRDKRRGADDDRPSA